MGLFDTGQNVAAIINAGANAASTAYAMQQQIEYNNALGKEGRAAAARSSAGLELSAAEQMQNQFNANEAQKQRDYEQMMSNTAYQRQVADMQAAGINPAMAMQKAGGATTPSGSAASASSPRQTRLDSFQNALAMKQMILQTQSAAAEVRLKEAQAENVESDTTGKDIENGFKAKYLQLQQDGQEMLNDISRKELNVIDQNLENLKKQGNVYDKEIENLEEERKLKIANRDYIENKKAIEKTTSEMAVELQPYIIAYHQAQTAAQKAIASLNFARAAYEKGLYSDEYIFEMQQGVVKDNQIKDNNIKTQDLKLKRDNLQYNFEQLELYIWKDQHGFNEGRSKGFNRFMNGLDIWDSVTKRAGISGDKLFSHERTTTSYWDRTEGPSVGKYNTSSALWQPGSY